MVDFSIIIPTFNDAELFKRSLISVISQKDVTFEIIIVDDSSNYEIEQIVFEINDSRILYTHNNPCLGAVNNWNYGFSLINGRFVVILHHDECFNDPHYQLSSYLSKFQMPFDILVANITVHFSNGYNRKMIFPGYIKTLILNFIPSFLFFINIIGPVSCLVFKKEMFKQFDSNLFWLVDVDWYYSMFKNNKICYCEEFLIHSFHGHKNQITKNIDLKNVINSDYKYLMEKYNNQIPVCMFLFLNRKLKGLKKYFSRQFNFIWKN